MACTDVVDDDDNSIMLTIVLSIILGPRSHTVDIGGGAGISGGVNAPEGNVDIPYLVGVSKNINANHIVTVVK